MLISLFTFENAMALFTLTAMEIVLGIDNLIFIAIMVAKLPEENRARARTLGILLALVLRIFLLFSLTWIMSLSAPLFTLFHRGFTGRDLILISGGLFLIGKSTLEIQDQVHENDAPDSGRSNDFARLNDPALSNHSTPGRESRLVSNTSGGSIGISRHHTTPMNGMAQAILQIMMIDLIFSVDSVVTAVGMAQALPVMIAAVVASMLIMLGLAGPIGNFIERNPTLKVLALAFLILIGVSLVVDGTGGHIGKGYIYFAMAFSLGVEMLNLRAKKKK